MVGAPCPLVPVAPQLTKPPFQPGAWVFDEKVGGWRMLAYRDGAGVRSCGARQTPEPPILRLR